MSSEKDIFIVNVSNETSIPVESSKPADEIITHSKEERLRVMEWLDSIKYQ